MCRNGENCNYAHGDAELRKIPEIDKNKKKQKMEKRGNGILREQLAFLSKKLYELYFENESVILLLKNSSGFLENGEIDLAADTLHVF